MISLIRWMLFTCPVLVSEVDRCQGGISLFSFLQNHRTGTSSEERIKKFHFFLLQAGTEMGLNARNKKKDIIMKFL